MAVCTYSAIWSTIDWITEISNLYIKILREVEVEVVLVVLDKDLLVFFLLLPVTGKAVLGTVVEEGNHVVAVDIASQDMGAD